MPYKQNAAKRWIVKLPTWSANRLSPSSARFKAKLKFVIGRPAIGVPLCGGDNEAISEVSVGFSANVPWSSNTQTPLKLFK